MARLAQVAGRGTTAAKAAAAAARRCLPEPLWTVPEVAALFRVDRKTVLRWAAAGKFTAIRTPGGHLRFRPGEIRSYISTGQPAQEATTR